MSFNVNLGGRTGGPAGHGVRFIFCVDIVLARWTSAWPFVLLCPCEAVHHSAHPLALFFPGVYSYHPFASFIPRFPSHGAPPVEQGMPEPLGLLNMLLGETDNLIAAALRAAAAENGTDEEEEESEYHDASPTEDEYDESEYEETEYESDEDYPICPDCGVRHTRES